MIFKKCLSAFVGGSIVRDDSKIPRHRQSDLKVGVALGCCLLMATLLTLLLHSPAGSQLATDVFQEEWNSFSNTYCSKEVGSVSLTDDGFGFRFAKMDCQQKCQANEDCNMFTFGRWWKLGVFYGQTRCQLYQSCAEKNIQGMSLFVRKKSLLYRIIKGAYFFQCTLNLLVMLDNRFAGACTVLSFLVSLFAVLAAPRLDVRVYLQLLSTLLLRATTRKLDQENKHIELEESGRERLHYLVNLALSTVHHRSSRNVRAAIEIGFALLFILTPSFFILAFANGISDDSSMGSFNILNFLSTFLLGVNSSEIVKYAVIYGGIALSSTPILFGVKWMREALVAWSSSPEHVLESQALILSNQLYIQEQNSTRGIKDSEVLSSIQDMTNSGLLRQLQISGSEPGMLENKCAVAD